MALTKSEWYDQIKSLYPRWFFELEENQKAHLQGLCGVLETIHSDLEDHFRETMITQSEGDFLDSHGAERSIDRLPNEFDAQYKLRVQNLGNQSNVPDIKALVDLVLIKGEADIIEDRESQLFASRGNYLNRDAILLDIIWNTFSVLIDKQLHDPYSFSDNEYFSNTGNFVGTINSSDYVLNLVFNIINSNKAQGTLFRIIERSM